RSRWTPGVRSTRRSTATRTPTEHGSVIGGPRPIPTTGGGRRPYSLGDSPLSVGCPPALWTASAPNPAAPAPRTARARAAGIPTDPHIQRGGTPRTPPAPTGGPVDRQERDAIDAVFRK